MTGREPQSAQINQWPQVLPTSRSWISASVYVAVIETCDVNMNMLLRQIDLPPVDTLPGEGLLYRACSQRGPVSDQWQHQRLRGGKLLRAS